MIIFHKKTGLISSTCTVVATRNATPKFSLNQNSHINNVREMDTFQGGNFGKMILPLSFALPLGANYFFLEKILFKRGFHVQEIKQEVAKSCLPCKMAKITSPLNNKKK